MFAYFIARTLVRQGVRASIHTMFDDMVGRNADVTGGAKRAGSKRAKMSLPDYTMNSYGIGSTSSILLTSTM